MKRDENNNHLNWGRIFAKILAEAKRRGIELTRFDANTPDAMEQRHLEQLGDKVRRRVYQEIMTAGRGNVQKNLLPKRIVLTVDIAPFHLPARESGIEELGVPWRHDGGKVSFKLKMPHDRLEFYTLKGEFVTSIPVKGDEVFVEDLEPGIYRLYLRGRKIRGMEPGDTE